ncbi:MAG TPA: hypothetical protein VGU43_03995, partial [Thermoplasmata archaeon]|nr:hypothetical protein [Thermoplasmata archaeon]
RQRNFGSIAIASWNTFAEIWDIATYVQGFQTAASTMRRGDRDRANITAVLVVAVAIALVITYFAFRAGLRRSEGAIADSPRQAAAENASTGGFDLGHRRHFRSTLLVGVVVLVVVVAAILAFHLIPPSPQVKVAEIDVWAPTNVCGLAGTPISYSGFSDMPGSSEDFQFQVVDYNATACTVAHAGTNTTGFSLSNVQLPITIQAGQSQFLNLTIHLPQGAFDGSLNLIYT